MALDHLLASLEREATAEATAVLADARARAQRLTGDAAERIARRRSDTLGVREQTQRAAVELVIARARRSARARVLEARARAIERVFAAVRERLPAVAAAPPFLAALPARLAGARACIGEAPGAVRCAPALAPALREFVAGAAGLSVHPDPAVATGFVLATCDGALVVDETLEARLARARPALAVLIVRALEPPSP